MDTLYSDCVLVWGRSLQPLGDFCDFAAKKGDFYVILIAIRTFKAIQITKLLKFRSYFKEH